MPTRRDNVAERIPATVLASRQVFGGTHQAHAKPSQDLLIADEFTGRGEPHGGGAIEAAKGLSARSAEPVSLNGA